MTKFIHRILYLFALYIHIGAKPIIVRKIIRNGQPEETSDTKKDTTKLVEIKTQKNESLEMETDKKEKPKLKPSIKPKVYYLYVLKIYVHFLDLLHFLYFYRNLARQLPKRTRNRVTKNMLSRKF